MTQNSSCITMVLCFKKPYFCLKLPACPTGLHLSFSWLIQLPSFSASQGENNTPLHVRRPSPTSRQVVTASQLSVIIAVTSLTVASIFLWISKIPWSTAKEIQIIFIKYLKLLLCNILSPEQKKKKQTKTPVIILKKLSRTFHLMSWLKQNGWVLGSQYPCTVLKISFLVLQIIFF